MLRLATHIRSLESDLPLKILFVVPYAPTRIRTRSFHLIRALAGHGHRLTVGTVWGSDEDREAVEELRALDNVDEVIVEHQSAVRPIWNCLRALPTSDPLQAHYSWEPRLAKRLITQARDTPFDIVHVEHLRGVEYGLALRRATQGDGRRPVLVWDAVDCISTLLRRASTESATRRVRFVARMELRRTEMYEAAVCSEFDRLLLTSEADRRELLELKNDTQMERRGASAHVLTQGVDLTYFSPSDEPREPSTLVITAKMSYHANATAVLWFARNVMPLVWRGNPRVRLWIVGQGPTREIERLGATTGGPNPRVVVTGAVDDVRPFLRRATLAVAPIRYSVGVQNKVLEALACGTPVLATPQGVAGLGMRPGQGVEIASSATDLARATLSLLGSESRREQLSLVGRAFVERQHDWSLIAHRVTGIYRTAMSELYDA